MTIEELEVHIKELKEQISAKFTEIAEFISNNELEQAEESKVQASELMTELKEKEKELEELKKEEQAKQEDTDKANNENTNDTVSKDAAEGEQRSMDNIVHEELVIEKGNEARSNYQDFLISGDVRSVKTEDAGVLVPEEVVTSIEKLTEDLDSLERLVTVKNVNNLSGSYPVRNADTKIAALPTVAELEESPELGLRKLGNQKYEIKTHRGLIKASWEAIDDGVEVESIINEEMAEAIVATKNKAILDALNAELVAVEAGDLDALKTVVNTGIAKRFAKEIVVSTDVYDALDKMKDSNGQYLLQPSVSAESGTRLFGKDLVVLDSDIIGEGVMYIGSLKDAAILFLRKELYVNYEIWNQYGKVFSPIIRLDAKVKNPKAVVKVNFAVTPEL